MKSTPDMPGVACAEVSQLLAVSATDLRAGDMPCQLPDLLQKQ